jgi:methylenetetrahydrofolate reductase (NADPH)
MKVADRWRSSTKPTLSFELFPARTEKAAINLEKAIANLAELSPDFVSVTFGAGGSTREGSYNLVSKLKHDLGLEVLAYFACYGLGPEEIISVLEGYQALGVENILAVRGDPPREGEFEPHPDSFTYASELVGFIRPKYDFCIGVAAYPEGHIDAPSAAQDLAFLKQKVDLGAEYIITNYFYDNRFFFDFVDRCQGAGINIPILPGVMPIYSEKMMNILANLCGASITDAVQQGLAGLPEGDKEALINFGIGYAFEQCAGLLKAGVPGLHIYTMDRSKSTVGIVTRLRAEGYL